MKGIKSFDKEGLQSRINRISNQEIYDNFDKLNRINQILLDCEEIINNCGIEDIESVVYYDMSRRLQQDEDDLIALRKIPDKIIEDVEEIDNNFSTAIRRCVETIGAFSTIEYNSNINDSVNIFNTNINNARQNILALTTINQEKINTNSELNSKNQQLEMYINARDAESDLNKKKEYDKRIHDLEQEIDILISKKVKMLNHGEGFSIAYDIIKDNDYTLKEREEIFLYWLSIDSNSDISGKEMPSWWKEKYLKLPYGIEITESNVVAIYENADKETRELLKQYYFESYIIIDCISKYPLIDDIGSIYSENSTALYSVESYYADDLVDIWLDNMYGGMYDYISGNESVRAVKYGLYKLYDYNGLYMESGSYPTLTNEDSTLYEFFIENYMLKCGHIEHYYENYKDGAKADRERQILEYLKRDIAVYELYLNKDKNELGIDANGKQILLDDLNVDINKFILTDMELRMLDYERASDSYEKYGYIDFMNQYTLAYQLMHHMYGIGERDFEINENVIKITFSGGVDITSGKDFEEVSYTFVLDDNKAYGGYFIDIDQMLGISNAIATEQIKNGYITGLKSDELDMQAYKLLEQYYTPEQLAFMTGDVLDERLEEAKIACLTTELALGSFKGEHLRSIDAFNFGKDVAVTSLQLIVLAIAISNPGTALAGGAYVVNGGVGIADGAIRIDQGDTFNGAMEMSLSFLEVGGGLKLVSETTSLGKYVDEFIRDNRGCVGAKKALEGSLNSELKVIGEYDSNKYFTKSVEFNAGTDGTGFTYKVYQRNDIDWNMVRTTGAKKGRGLTNAQAAEKYGLAPILDDGYVATLHHSQQKSVGPLFEASTRYHNISNAKKGPLHPYNGQLNPFSPMDSKTRGLFQKVDSIEYWKARGRDALKGVY